MQLSTQQNAQHPSEHCQQTEDALHIEADAMQDSKSRASHKR